MLLTKLANLRFIHAAGTNSAVADIISQDFSTITTKTCQLQHKTLPPDIEFTQLHPNTI